MKTLPVNPGDVAVIDPVEASQGNAFVQSFEEPDQKVLRALVERRHPMYECTKEHWEFLELTYNGGREWFEKHLHRYRKEGEQEFRDRIKRAYRFNHTREVVDLLNKYLFKQNITRNEVDAPESVKKFWAQATNGGQTIKDLARQVSKKSSIYGRIAIVIDNNAPSGTVVSKADEETLGIKTYAYTVPPEQVLDYSFDDQGQLNWILLAEIRRDDSNPLTSSGAQKLYWRLWTRDAWVLLTEVTRGKKKFIVVEDTGVTDLGMVPVVLADNIVSDDEWVTPALIDDIAYLDKAVGNYLSNLDAIIQDQTFSQLAMPAQAQLPGDENYNKMMEVGTKRIFTYDGEEGAKPFYLSPDVKQAGLILDAINKIINEIYHTVGLAGERTKQDNSQGIDNSSGVAKAYDFERVNALLAAKADSLEIIENKVVKIVAAWSGEEADIKGPLVSYPDSFDTRGLYDEFDLAARLMLVDAPDSVRRQQMLMVIDKLFPQLDKAKRDQMEAELKNWPPEIVEENTAADATRKTADKNTATNVAKAT